MHTGPRSKSYNFPGTYIRHRGFKLYVEGGTTDLFKQDATFYWTSPALFRGSGGSNEIVLQHQTNRRISMWSTFGTETRRLMEVNQTPEAGWKVVGAGEFNPDGRTDIVLQHETSRRVAVWLMDGTGINVASSAEILAIPPAGWKVVSTGQFNADGRTDIVLQHNTSRRVAVWLMDGNKVLSSAEVDRTPDAGWKVVGAATNTINTIVLQNETSRRIGVWLMNGSKVASTTEVDRTPDAGWQVKAVYTPVIFN